MAFWGEDRGEKIGIIKFVKSIKKIIFRCTLPILIICIISDNVEKFNTSEKFVAFSKEKFSERRMRMPKKIASYKIINGNRYSFFCDLSGARVFITEPIVGGTPEERLKRAWEIAKPKISRCEKCGRFVCDAMYNADTFMCVDCSPWENPPKFCRHCGSKVSISDTFCTSCGSALRYEEV